MADMDAAVTLRDTIGKSLKKMEDRPRKIAQLGVARDLKARIADFDLLARTWRDAGDAVAASQAVLGEAAHLMNQADEAAARKLKILEPAMKEADGQRLAAHARQEAARANALAVQRLQVRQQIAQAEQEAEQAETEVRSFKDEESALNAAGFIADIRRQRAEAQIRRDALLQADEALSPLLQRIDSLALQYHARLDGDRRRLLDEVGERESRIVNLASAAAAAEGRRATLAAQLEDLEEKVLDNAACVRAAEERRDALPLQPGERPEDARERLVDEIGALDERLTAAHGRRAAIDEEMRAGDSRWRTLQREHSEADVQRQQAGERKDDEARQRQQLLASTHLQRVAGTPEFEPTSAELVSRFDDTIVRSRDQLARKERRRQDLEMELERLTGIDTLTVDDQTRKLIVHFHAEGISPGELKAFPEYLAGLYASPEEIARFIEGDPGRFTGIMAATEEVVEAVQGLPVPEWLHRPVVVSTPVVPDRLQAVAQAVICPNDPGVYSKHHLEKTRDRIRGRLDALVSNIDEHTGELREMAADSQELHAYRESFPDAAAVTALTERVRELDHTLADLAAEIADAEDLSEILRERRAEQEQAIQALAADAVRLAERRSQVEAWLERYALLEDWKRDAEEMISAKAALAASIDAEDRNLRQIEAETADLRGDIRERRIMIKGLDERAGDVPKPEDA
ncbi:MAG: hypothetical protein V2I57_05420, partial [Xanthomonadales bacterium]|nr:hypothetical protein [Xanthomonadales bacterium]